MNKDDKILLLVLFFGLFGYPIWWLIMYIILPLF